MIQSFINNNIRINSVASTQNYKPPLAQPCIQDVCLQKQYVEVLTPLSIYECDLNWK